MGRLMILVWFVYGLAFFVLGLAILLYPKKDSRFELARHIWMVGVFGIVHGLNEWLDMFIAIGGPIPPALAEQGRMVTLPTSFFFLVFFGVTILSRNKGKRRLLRAIPFLLIAVWVAIFLLSKPDHRLLMGDIWSRYLLCLPGTVLTAWGLFSQVPGFKVMRLHSITRNLEIAAATFLVYGVLAGVFSKKAGFFPSTILNRETFLALTGVPVQIFRAVCAVIMAWSVVRMLDVFRWETQEALRVSDLRCATIASAMPVFLFMADRKTVVTFIQGKGLDALGLPPEQILGRRVSDVFPSGEQFAEDCRRALSGESFITTACLGTAFFEIYYSAFKDRAGKVTGLVGVALDVSARIQTQRELDEYRKKLEKHAREAAVGVLSATVGQQVAEPLSATQLILEKTAADLGRLDAPQSVRSSISRSLSEIMKAQGTLTRFMDLAHPGVPAAEQPVGIYQIAKRTMSVFAESAQRRNLVIAIKDMDIVPLMAISPREVEQIFYHLIQRAVDAANGTMEQKLIIDCSVNSGYVELLFVDMREGLEHGPLEHAGDSIPHDLEEVEHWGLGLAVVKRIVTDHGGQVTVEIPSDGTTIFRVRLPTTQVY
jgi:signal transduction histidine kinase